MMRREGDDCYYNTGRGSSSLAFRCINRKNQNIQEVPKSEKTYFVGGRSVVQEFQGSGDWVRYQGVGGRRNPRTKMLINTYTGAVFQIDYLFIYFKVLKWENIQKYVNMNTAKSPALRDLALNPAPFVVAAVTGTNLDQPKWNIIDFTEMFSESNYEQRLDQIRATEAIDSKFGYHRYTECEIRNAWLINVQPVDIF